LYSRSGWPDAFLKSRPKCCPNHFFSENYYITFTVVNSSPQKCVYFCKLLKTTKVNNLLNTKIRRIWSPCSRSSTVWSLVHAFVSLSYYLSLSLSLTLFTFFVKDKLVKLWLSITTTHP
jgi:hypothetical protein